MISRAIDDGADKSVVSASAGAAAGGPDGSALMVRIVLDDTQGMAGAAIQGQALITNNTGGALTVRACPDDWLSVGLASETVQFDPPVSAVLCTGPQWPTVPTGTSSWPVTVGTTFLGCSSPGEGFVANPQIPPCIGEPGGDAPIVPPLPPGRYEVRVIVRGLSPEPTLTPPGHVTLSG